MEVDVEVEEEEEMEEEVGEEVEEVQSSLWSGSCSCCIAPSHQPMQPTHLNLLQKCK